MPSAQCLRVDELVRGSGSFSFTDNTWKTNFLIVSHTVGMIFVNVGYGGHLIQQSVKSEAQARQRQAVAEESWKTSTRLLEERDHMLMLNSQLASVSAMGVLSGAIIHELAQPLQALRLAAYGAQTSLSADTALKEQLGFVQKQAENCQTIIQSLRNIIARGRDETAVYNVGDLLNPLLCVVESECRRQDIVLSCLIVPHAVPVHCNAVMFQRVVLNLVANAIEALQRNTDSHRYLRITLTADNAKARLEVADNSGTPIAETGTSFDLLRVSTREQGVGMGLMICSRIVEAWGGRFRVMQSSEKDLLTLCSLEMPLAS